MCCAIKMYLNNKSAFSVQNSTINCTERLIDMNLDQYPDVLTLHECQQILQVSRGTMLRLQHENEIPAFEFIERDEY